MTTKKAAGFLTGLGVTAVIQSSSAIIQSSSASVGILQALSATGQVTYGSAIPIIMEQSNLNLHETSRALRTDNERFEKEFKKYSEKYSLN